MLRIFFALLAAVALIGPANAQSVPSFEAFAQDPAITGADVSPNGRWLAVVQRASIDGERFVRIYDARNLGRGPTRTLGARGTEVTSASWLNNDQLLVSFRQQFNEGSRTYSVGKVATIGRERGAFNEIPKVRFDRRALGAEADQLTNQAGASIISALPEDPDHIIVSYTANFTRGSNGFVPVRNVGKVNVQTGIVVENFRGDTRYGGFRVDQDGEVRLASSADSATGDQVFVARAKGQTEWLEIGRTGAGTTGQSQQFGVLGFFNIDDQNEIIVVSNHDADTAGIYTFDILSRQYKELLFRHPRYDAVAVRSTPDLQDARRRYLTGFRFDGRGGEVVWIDDFEKRFHQQVEAALPDRNISVVSQSSDQQTRVIRANGERYPTAYWLYTPADGLKPIGESLPLLSADQLADRRFVRYTARDGYEIPAYVTIPNGQPPFPTVVMPHGGPVARDSGGFDLWAQVLASRGYAVIQPQFRVSDGFGRAHLEAGFNEWGLLQQDDIDDAGKFLINAGVADPDNIAIFGWSYGGYSAAVAAARDPNMYQCAIPGAAVTDLPDIRAQLFVGGSSSPLRRYRETVEGLNPLDMADSVDIPVLIIHGTEDERVPIRHADKFYAALRRNNKDVEYLKLDGANHFFGTIYYRHWMEMFPTLIRFLDEDCAMKD